MTAVTHYKRLSFFYAQYRNEKETEIVIHPFVVSLVQPAHRTPLRILIQNLYFRGNTGDEYHEQKLEYWSFGVLVKLILIALK